MIPLLLLLAEELLTPGEEVLRDLTAALARGDEAAAASLLLEAGEIARWPASPEEAQAILRAAGEASQSRRLPVALAAIRALGRTGREDAAPWLEPFLKGAAAAGDEEECAIEAAQAAGRIRAPLLLGHLVRLAQHGESLNVAAQALLALAEYSQGPPGLRREAVERVLDLGASMERGGRERWRRLRAPALRALQRLVGRKLNSIGQFSDWWAAAKTRKDPFPTGKE